MDDIIILILTLIFIVAGIFGQMKKKPEAPDTEVAPPPESDDNFWDLLEDDENFMEQDRQANVATEPPAREAAPQPPQYRFKTDKEKPTVQQQEKNKTETKTRLKKSIKKKAFPLKEAVIYSEILNRKYT